MEQSVSKLTNLLRRWEDEMSTINFNPIPTLIRLCELFETETKKYLINNPDHFYDHHKSRIDNNCVLGKMYEILFRKDSLMNKLIMDYLKEHHWPRQTKDNHDLNVTACRLIMNLIPGLETTIVFESRANDQLIQKLFTWAENTNEPLQTYATRLLAYCMELTDTAANFKDNNNKLVPIILDRLHSYYTQFCEEKEINQSKQPYQNTNSEQPNDDTGAPSSKMKKREENGICGDSSFSYSESITSNWIQIYPPTLTTKLVYCLKYLVPTGEYQELLSHVYEKNSLNLVMKIINSSEKQNGYITFEALKYLASLLCHKNIVIKFIDSHGLQKLLLIPKPSIPSTGVSICFYYLSYCEEAMERICLLPEHVLIDLVKYALCMLECSNDSSRCHATMFFSYSFHFRVIQEIFDNHDGLRKLFNVVSTLPILSSEDPAYSSITEDAECSAKQIIRHACAGLKHYFEAHLHKKAQQIRRAKITDSGLLVSSTMVHNYFTVPGYKSTKKSRVEVQEEIELLSNVVSLNWTPIDQLLKLGGLSLLLKIISLAYKWNFSGRQECEMIKNALEVLNICAVLPKAQLAFCEIASPNFQAANQNGTSAGEDDDPQAENSNVGLNIIIKAAGDLLDADIQKAALSVIITCVCGAPMYRECGSTANFSSNESNNRQTPKTPYAMIEKMFDCFRNNNGIMVLVTLMTIKTPITDVDAIRGLASRALAGLARSESVRQIIRELPLFNSGQLQSLMKNPVLEVNRQEHVTFQKYALELMEIVLGEKKSNGAKIEASLASLTSINRANVVAQTDIKYDEQQVLLLMYQHLMAKGLSTTAESLLQEANLNISEKRPIPFTNISHCRNQSIGGGISPINSRHMIQNKKSELAYSSNGPLGAVFSARGIKSITPKRLNIIRRSENLPKPEPEQEVESPMSKSVNKKMCQDLTSLNDYNTNSEVSLESIVTEYFTNQHASCLHPMVTCPQFNFFVQHKCPDPNPRSSVVNFAMRFSKNINSRKLNQRLIHSRFCPTSNFRMDFEREICTREYYTRCKFLSQNHVAVGTKFGAIKVLNLFTSQEELSFSAHAVYINNLQCSNDERLLISSSNAAPKTSIWSISEDEIELKYSLDLEEYCTFSNYDQNKILGTRDSIATIYDLETSERILTLVPKLSNRYIYNRATFDPTNELVFSDGVLWDTITGKEIHKFDKLNLWVNGIFHPNGLEIISNKEVWDMRTFKLLHTVPILDKCEVKFSKSGEGMYLHFMDAMGVQPERGSIHRNSFITLDPNDYTNIATVDVKKTVIDIACNNYDTQIAIVENQRMAGSIDESIVQIYDVGRFRNEDEDEAVEEQHDEKVDSESSGSEDENRSRFLLYMEEMGAEGMAAREMNDNTSSSRSSNSSSESVGDSSRSFTPLFDLVNDPSYDASESSLSDSSDDPSYDAVESSDPEDPRAYFYYEM